MLLTPKPLTHNINSYYNEMSGVLETGGRWQLDNHGCFVFCLSECLPGKSEVDIPSSGILPPVMGIEQTSYILRQG